MASATVRYWRGGWVVDVSTVVDGKRKRQIKSFGAGSKAKRAAEAFRDEIGPQAKAGKFWERQTATFADLWQKFEAHELIGPTPGPATIADYKAVARLYLLPRLRDRLLAELDAEAVTAMRAALLSEAGAKAAGKEGGGKPLSARTVAKILTLLGTVFRYGKRIGLMRDNPAAEVKKPRAATKTVYTLDVEEIARLRAAFNVPWQRLLFEVAVTTGLRSGEIRGVTWSRSTSRASASSSNTKRRSAAMTTPRIPRTRCAPCRCPRT